jgi:very-short-patch-repair endonuclease
MQCKICNTRVKNLLLALSVHLKTHNLTLLEYYVCYEDFKIPKCCFCQDSCKNTKGLKFYKTCGKKECISKDRKSRKHTEESKERLRKKRFEYLKKKLGKTAWEKRKNKELSELELWFFNVIKKHSLEKKYDIVNEYAEYPYFIDFAFINIKLAVEIDGPAHFRNGKRFEHDLKKDQDLLNKGWKIVRIAYDELNEATIDKFLELLNNIVHYKYEAKKLEDHVYRYSTIRKIRIKKQEIKRQEQKQKKN